MEGLVASKRQAPADDVVSDLAALAAPPGRIAMLAATLLFTGHETTAARIDFGTLLLALHPAQWEMLHHDPALVPGAVEEILRFAPTTGGLVLRYARTGIDLGSTRIQAGDAVLLAFAAANRAPQVFPDPDRFDITRQPNPHLAFGHGQHYCIGGSLARIELQAALTELARCLQAPRLAVPLASLPVREDVFARSLTALPVSLTACPA
jgi:cytochrome P450